MTRFFKIQPLERNIIWTSLFILVTGNLSFFRELTNIYPLSLEKTPFLFSVFLLFLAATVFFLSLLSWSKLGKWFLAFMLIASAAAAHFMDSYHAVISSSMLINLLQTNPAEASDLINFSFIARLLLLGLLPAFLVIRYTPYQSGYWLNFKSKFIVLGGCVFISLLCIAPQTSHYATFFRAHKTVRFYANPTYFSYSTISLAHELLSKQNQGPLRSIATDSAYQEQDELRELMILVVGETARADHFSLNGYARKTNPELEQLNVLSLKNVWSCGTSTAVSVPCMFSNLGQANYDNSQANSQQNVLDVLKRMGVNILWRDNNSDSKGVALRVQYEDYKTSPPNTLCNPECRDLGMLEGLQQYINNHPTGDILIVLHQMGNHGPAYYKRYPPEFERFTPVCKTSELSNCSKEEIVNAYDNAILYTDHFLAETIRLLQKNDEHFETTMGYVSDHGESLGENGLYLHGAPYAFAPDTQKHVPAVLWFGKNHRYQTAQFKPYENHRFSHDDLFCKLLVSFEINNEHCSPTQTMQKSSK